MCNSKSFDFVTQPIQQTVTGFKKVFTAPGKANLGDFASVALPGVGGTIVSDVKNPTNLIGQAAVIGAAVGGAALLSTSGAGAAGTAGVVGGTGSTVSAGGGLVGGSSLDLAGGTSASFGLDAATPTLGASAALSGSGGEAALGASSGGILSDLGSIGSDVLGGAEKAGSVVATTLSSKGLIGGLLTGAGSLAQIIGGFGQKGLQGVAELLGGSQGSSALNGLEGDLGKLINGSPLASGTTPASSTTVVQPGAAAPSSSSLQTYLLIGGVLLAAYLLLGKKGRKAFA